MTELVGLLGTLSALLTLVGVYRFTGFFFNQGPGLAAMLAVAATAVFLLFFEQIILVVGLLTIASPVAAVLYWRGAPSVPSGLPSVPLSLSHLPFVGSGTNTGGGSTANSSGSNDTTNECPNCGETNEPDATFCEECGWRLDT
ncbi:MAG: zinc ribbon domain-containing protein [Natronomonas sp.]